MQLEIHGARGSAPVHGREFARYGGYTTCFEIALPEGRRLIIDAGTGLHRMQTALMRREASGPLDATILLTHFHWDHIEGLPTFAPLFDAATRLHFVGAPPAGHSIEGALDAVMRPPWFPVAFRDSAAQMSFEVLGSQPISVGPFEITSVALTHPGGVTGYRLEHAGGALVVATDVEAGDGSASAAVRELAKAASVLIHDAQYLTDEYATRRKGWGHSTWRQASENALAAQVGRLVLTSHDPIRTDEEVEGLAADARAIFPRTEAAAEGQLIEF